MLNSQVQMWKRTEKAEARGRTGAERLFLYYSHLHSVAGFHSFKLNIEGEEINQDAVKLNTLLMGLK